MFVRVPTPLGFEEEIGYTKKEWTENSWKMFFSEFIKQTSIQEIIRWPV
jgi:hypothetical protein